MKRLEINEVKPGICKDIGLQPLDILYSYNGRPLHSSEALSTAMKVHDKQTHTLKYIRGDKILEADLTAGKLGVNVQEINFSLDFIPLSTMPTIPGYKVTKSIDIVSAECVFGMNIFKDFFAGMTDFFGGRSGSTQQVLKDAKQTCLNELRIEAASIGADAIAGIDLDYSEFSGQGKSMLFLVASGTAVKTEPEIDN